MGQIIPGGLTGKEKRDLGEKMEKEKMARAGKSLDVPALEPWTKLGRKKTPRKRN